MPQSDNSQRPRWKPYEVGPDGVFSCPVYSAQRTGDCGDSATETGAGFSGKKSARFYSCLDGHRFSIHIEQGIHGPEMTWMPVNTTPEFGTEI